MRLSHFARRLANRTGQDLPDLVAFLLVLAVVIAIAGVMFAGYYGAPDLLWRGFHHDRNSHYSFGLDLALALRHFDPLWFFTELERSKVWPPVHGLVLSVILFFGGIDYRLAILPSLIGWVTTVSFVWLITRRLFVDRINGLFAAAIAVILTAASPAFRLISSDVMLEGLGAGFSAAALWAYLRAFADPNDPARWRLLAVILTVLFFQKGNYWGLVVASLAIAYVLDHRRQTIDLVRATIARIDAVAVHRALREPLLILFFIVLTLTLYLYWRGPTVLMLFNRPVSFYPPENLTTVAYALLFGWGVRLWRRHRDAIGSLRGWPGRALLVWHVMPIAVSFLLPRRLSRFIWFVGPANNLDAPFDPLQGVWFYWEVFAQGFHMVPWVATVAVTLAAIGAIGVRSLTPGSRVIFVFAAVAFAGVVIHPQHQGRFLSSWVFVVWICSGAGAGVLLGWVLGRAARSLRTLVGTALAALLLVVNAVQRAPAAAAMYSLHPVSGPSDVELVRPYLAELDGARKVGILTTFGISKLFAWVIREHCRCNKIILDPFIAGVASRQEARDMAAERIARWDADVIVTIDARGDRHEAASLGWIHSLMAGQLDAMENQTRYKRGNSYDLPGQDARATIWRLQ